MSEEKKAECIQYGLEAAELFTKPQEYKVKRRMFYPITIDTRIF